MEFEFPPMDLGALYNCAVTRPKKWRLQSWRSLGLGGWDAQRAKVGVGLQIHLLNLVIQFCSLLVFFL